MPLSRYAGSSLASAPSQSDKPILISIEGLPIISEALDGQLLIGDSGAGMVLALLTEGAGISITNAPGSITIAATGQVALEVNAQIGTDYTLVASDNGKVVTLDNADPITLTVPAALGAGFSCLLMQLGAGVVTVTPDAATVDSRGGLLDLNGQFAIASLVPTAVEDAYVLGGDLA